MEKFVSIKALVCLFTAAVIGSLSQVASGEQTHVDLSKQKTLYAVSTAHLDTQWNWPIQDSINYYIPWTLRANFYLMNEHPDYDFSFEGAFRYMLAKEYYPEDYARLKEYVKKGQWHVAGSSIDAGDVNVPSPESLFRQVLYGNKFFQKEFGKKSCDIFLPDCFGFGYALPSIAAHAGLKGFSTQKLTWGSSEGIPFPVGVWEGPDGSSVAAVFDASSYRTTITEDLSSNEKWLKKIDEIGDKSGVYAGYMYYGTGDRGGSPGPGTVSNLEKSIAGTGPIRVISSSSDQIFRDLTPEQMTKLPKYNGELVMTTHGVGCYTSQAMMKRWNRKNELLADATERAATAADWLGAATYPKDTLREAWTRFLWHQFHDDLTGTSTPQVYSISWNDELISMNQFAGVLSDSVGAVARALDTRAKGIPVIVYNPLSHTREDVVEARIHFTGGVPRAISVYGPDGKAVPSQIVGKEGQTADILFTAKVSPVSFTVYDVRAADKPYPVSIQTRVSESSIENSFYKVSLDKNGDVASIVDKNGNIEMLAGSARLEMLSAFPRRYPAWEIEYQHVAAEPRSYVSGPAKVRIMENGPVRVCLEVTRHTEGSTFVQRIRLSQGSSGQRIEFDNVIDWKTKGTLLKTAFPLTVKNEKATYDLGLGVIERSSNTERKYEVPAQQWADLTDTSSNYGVSILNDCKYGWDKPNDNTLRLTLLYTPETSPDRYPYQGLQDFGAHRVKYALVGHRGKWNTSGAAVKQAGELNQPLLAFQAKPHKGSLERALSMVRLSEPSIDIRTIKMAEDSDEIVVRLQETAGKDHKGVRLAAISSIKSAREINASEEPAGSARVESGKLIFDLSPFQPRTFALKLDMPPVRLAPPVCKPLSLPYDCDVVSFDDNKADGNFDGRGNSIPGELIPPVIKCGDISFKTGPAAAGKKNAVTCRSQKITLPAGRWNRLYILAASAGTDIQGTFHIDGKPVKIRIQDCTGQIGQWYAQAVDGYRLTDTNRLIPAYIKSDRIAWNATHLHSRDGQNIPYAFGYLYKYGIDLPKGAKIIKLPDNSKIRILAATLAVNENDDIAAASPLMDELVPAPVIKPYDSLFLEKLKVEITSAGSGEQIHFTLDGSEPSASSPVYEGPFFITQNTTIKAKSFINGLPLGATSIASYPKTTLREPENPAKTVNGLDYTYWEGGSKSFPNSSVDKAKKQGTVTDFDITCADKNQDFSLRFTGFIDIPRDGVYTFYTRSNVHNRLYIGNVELTDCNFAHGGDQIDSASIALRAGKHAITLEYNNNQFYSDVQIDWQGPGIKKQKIPKGLLYRARITDGWMAG